MELMYKIPVIIILGFIVFSLAQGMYYLAKDDGDEDKTRVVKALTVRIVLSLTLFLLLILGYFLGMLQPSPLS
ncbi:twin transmembrane helix small protein [Candidatus Thiosymbion oneisti]|uniref:twin transmembrane helix small protein n=1 Tax=Candidatus Thiosymbion oneisti TaxID=589554 RepID=UPI00105F2BA5|nr:twin transmembrane helix small protein [Candidatus Thiosymbion oneisti]